MNLSSVRPQSVRIASTTVVLSALLATAAATGTAAGEGATVAPASPAPAAVASAPGADVSLSRDGTFTVRFVLPRFEFAGQVGQPVTDIARSAGHDRIGSYTAIAFDYADGGRSGSIRAYRDLPVVLFGTTYREAGANTEAFPTFSSYPSLPYRQTYQGCFADSQFNADGDRDGPWLAFNQNAEGFVVSPASHFPVARTWRTAAGDLASGIDPAIDTVPAGTTQQTLLVAEQGIGQTYQTWGNALTDLNGKNRPANDADVTLNKLGYWTDNGATYYYNYEPELGYTGTLKAVKEDWDARGIPMGYLQLDSWFYPKGPDARWDDGSGGTYRYQAAADLFPNDLEGFRDDIGVPLVTHNRWIDPASPYRSEYAVSGNVVTDPAFWQDRMRYLADSGVTTYEQDWLCSHGQPDYNLTDRDAYLDNMAQATAAQGLTMQYCMALPRDFLQGSKYSNLTTIRVSGDRFERGKWDAFLYTSQLAAAIGAWPWTDVMMSTEPRNVLLATLSAGPVGVGDAIGAADAGVLRQVARPDGVIVKPDVPITPTDETYVAEAAGDMPAMVAATHTDHGQLRHGYVYAYARQAQLPMPDTVYQAEDAVLSGPVVATDHSDYTGSGFVDYQHASGDYVEWKVQAPSDGTYTLLFRYANGGGTDRPLDVTVNGTSMGAQPFATTGGWDNWLAQPVVVDLRAGENTVRATATGASGANIDYLGVSEGVVIVNPDQDASFTPRSLGIRGSAYVYDYFAGSGQVVAPGRAYTDTVDRTGRYYLVAPINRSGIAFLGDAGRFASLGHKRVTELTDDGVTVRSTVSFAPSEGSVTMRGFAKQPVTVRATYGSVGDLSYDGTTGRFSFRVEPGAEPSASFTISPTS